MPTDWDYTQNVHNKPMLTPLARNSNDGGSSINFITQNIGHVNYFFFSNNIGTYSLSASAPLPLSYVIYGRLRGSGIAMSDQNEVNVPDEVLAHQGQSYASRALAEVFVLLSVWKVLTEQYPTQEVPFSVKCMGCLSAVGYWRDQNFPN